MDTEQCKQGPSAGGTVCKQRSPGDTSETNEEDTGECDHAD